MPNRLESDEFPYSAGQKFGDIRVILQQSDAISSAIVSKSCFDKLIFTSTIFSLKLILCHE
jgi:hypothetical protein